MDLPPPPHRKNRRRERPGQRTRRTLSRRNLLQQEFAEAQHVAHNKSIWLSGENQSPCLCRACHWERTHFPGRSEDEMGQIHYREEANDEELRQMGILYNIDEEAPSRSAVESPIPEEYSVRYVRPKRSPRPRFQLPDYLAASLLGDNPDIARWMLQSSMVPTPASNVITPATQFWSRFPRNQLQSQIQSQPHVQFPQSLPPTLSDLISVSTLSGTDNSRSALVQQQSTLQTSFPRLFPLNNDDEDLNDSTWDFITNSTRPGSPALSLISTPAIASMSTPTLSSITPETWTMLSDDS